MWIERCNLVLNLLDGLEEQRPLSPFLNSISATSLKGTLPTCYTTNTSTGKIDVPFGGLDSEGKIQKKLMLQPLNLTEEIKFPPSLQMTASPTMIMKPKQP
jgi:hypothetical protein